MDIIRQIHEILEILCDNASLVYAMLINGDKIKEIAHKRDGGELYILCDLQYICDVEEVIRILNIEDITIVSATPGKMPRIDICISRKWLEDIECELKFSLNRYDNSDSSSLSSSEPENTINVQYIDICGQRCYTNGIVDNEHDALDQISSSDISDREEIYSRLFAVWENYVTSKSFC